MVSITYMVNFYYIYGWHYIYGWYSYYVYGKLLKFDGYTHSISRRLEITEK